MNGEGETVVGYTEVVREKPRAPKISVIVPVYKAEKYLRKCVDSILGQTFRDFELLLVDDGSPDGSGAICDEYARKDSRVRVFHKENGGVSSARQYGLDQARGEYTIHADPDDWVEPGMLEALYGKAKAEGADMVICDFYVNDRRGQRYVAQRPTALDHESVLRDLFQRLHGSLCNKLVRRACYSTFGVKFPPIHLCEDLYVNVSLLLAPLRVAYVAQAFYHYEQDQNPNTLSRRKGRDFDTLLQAEYVWFDRLLLGTKFEPAYLIKKAHDAYSQLIFGTLTRQEYAARYASIATVPTGDFQIRCAKLALRYYRLALWLVGVRTWLGRIYHQLFK